MGRKVLVLNSDFRAMAVCSVTKAFLLVYMNKAEVLSRSEDVFLRTVNTAYPMPSVIRLYNYTNVPYKSVILSRQNIFKRDFYSCVYCGSHHNLTLDHVIPKSRGGKSSWTNLVTACQSCNSRKGDLTPEEAGMKMRHRPFKPSFVMFLKNFSKVGDESWNLYLDA